MNRIEEALKRAEADAAGGPTIDPPSAAENRTLDDYPSEIRAGAPADPPPAVTQPRAAERQPPRAAASGAIRLSGDEAERLVAGGIAPASLEQYRRLAAGLHQQQIERGIKLVMVASAAAGEGKTLTATNLALTLSQSYGRRVLLVDADFRRPTIHRMFGIAGEVGLNQALQSAEPRRPDVTRVSPTLAVLPAGIGDADPMGALTSDRMRAMLREAGEAFDWVVLDTPPVALADAHLLAAMVDVAILVVRAGTTPYQLVLKAIDLIGRQRIVGVVLNCADPRLLAPGNYGYYYAYTPAREVSS